MHLVIVESPAKAKTIKKFLGKDFTVEASMGHIRDLPSNTIGVDVKKNFEPTYQISDDKASVAKRLKDLAKKSDDVWIATDEDREGEAIGWHITQMLGIKKIQDVKRIVFHEITKSAILEAVDNPREIDMRLVDAQQARRILDRLVGYTLSPFLWRKVYSGLSAGRVQSVAVRIIVDREREIRAFVAVEYWTIDADLETDKKKQFTASLREKDGKKFVPSSQEESDAVIQDVKDEKWRVKKLEEKELKKSPPPPFTTSTLQQEAARKFGFSVKQTMVVAQQLYEGMSLGKGEGTTGLITYMRTDSVNLSKKSLDDIFETVEKRYGREYVLSEPRRYKTKSKGAQEAHEAIRPTEVSRTPESLKDILDHQQLKLYTLIWNRTMATQMAAVQLKRVGANIEAGSYIFRATGQTVLFDGYYRVYTEGRDASSDTHRKDDEEGSEKEGEKLLPPLKEGEEVTCSEVLPEQHFTKPPPRYTEASLVKKLEEEGIGRPSTYAPTISTVQQRGYIRKESKQLVPEEIAFTVTDLLAEHFTNIVNLSFTASMEDDLDGIAEGKKDYPTFLKDFYEPFHALIDSKSKEVKKEDVLKDKILGTDPASGEEVLVRIGRFGPYVQLGHMPPLEKGQKKKDVPKPKTAALPKSAIVAEVTLEQALALLSFPRELGLEGGEMVTANLGRFGPYIRCGKITAALPKDADPSLFTLEEALTLMKEAKEKHKKAQEPLKDLGKDPTSKGDILVKDGRFGPYVTDGKTNASLGKKYSPDDVTFEIAVELLEKKRARGPSKRWGKKK
jgi:DNA topoisomerase I